MAVRRNGNEQERVRSDVTHAAGSVGKHFDDRGIGDRVSGVESHRRVHNAACRGGIAVRTVVESFKRLFAAGRLTKEQIADRVMSGKIDAAEYEYITGEVYEA